MLICRRGLTKKWGNRDDGLRLASCSPAIDKGEGGSTEGVDMANQTRIIDIASIPNGPNSVSDGIDIGAYEFQNTGVSSQTLYVNASLPTGLNDGSSWANAFRGPNAFGTALQYANNCDDNTILVAKGTYKPHTLPFGFSGSYTSRNYTFSLKVGLKIYGGFDGTETTSTYSTQKARQNETILSGDFADDDIVTGEGGTLDITNNSENAYHVITSAIFGVSTLKGFTIKGGNANGTGYPESMGGGIKSNYYVDLTDCIIKHNAASIGGGVYGVSMRFERCYFEKNKSMLTGGGISTLPSSFSGITALNCVFRVTDQVQQEEQYTVTFAISLYITTLSIVTVPLLVVGFIPTTQA